MGYLRDIRRLTVALSRARLGLYILGRREVFESCYELRQAFELLLQRPDKLALITGELWPSTRTLPEEVNEPVAGEAVMESVEHLGQYVYEMTNTKINDLETQRGPPEGAALPQVMDVEKPEGEKQDLQIIDEEEETPVQGFEATEEN